MSENDQLASRPAAATGRRFAVSHISNLDAWPRDLGVPGEPFCLLLLCSDPEPEVGHVQSFADRALRQGMLYLSVWGPASDEIERTVDDVYVDSLALQHNPHTLVTTAHADLNEALAFFENDARPAAEVHTCVLWWVVSVGDKVAGDMATRKLAVRHVVEDLSLSP